MKRMFSVRKAGPMISRMLSAQGEQLFPLRYFFVVAVAAGGKVLIAAVISK